MIVSPPVSRNGWGWIGISSAAVAAAGLWLVVRGPSPATLGETLVHEANARASAVHARPVHVPPALPGTSAEALAAFLSRFEALDASLPNDSATVCGPLTGPPSGSPACRTLIEAANDGVFALLEVPHAQSGGVPEPMGVFADPHVLATGSDGWRPVMRWTKRALYAARLAHFDGDVGTALAMDLDVLALTRDLSEGSGLAGRILAVTLTRLAFDSVAAALDSAPVQRKRAAGSELRLIESGVPGFAEIVRDESLAAQLRWCGRLLDDRQVATLLPELRPLAHFEPAGPSGLVEGVLTRNAWASFVETNDAIARAAGLPEPERHDRMRLAEQKAASSRNPMTKATAPDFDKYLDSHDEGQIRLELLAAAAAVDVARAEGAGWPGSVRTPPGSPEVHVIAVDPNQCKVETRLHSGETLSIIVHADPR